MFNFETNFTEILNESYLEIFEEEEKTKDH